MKTLKDKIGMPMAGFGTLVAPGEVTVNATADAISAGFRHFDCAERYRNEKEVGLAFAQAIAKGEVSREELFITSKLWNTNHRPDRVERAFDASLERLGISYMDLYLIHTPYAFLPGEDQDPRDEKGEVIYDSETSLLDTWRAMEKLVDSGKCKAIGLSDISLKELKKICRYARIKPAVIQIESHPYLPETELLEFCEKNEITFLAFAPLGHGIKPGPLTDDRVVEIAQKLGRSPAQVLLSWALQRGTAFLTTPKGIERARENFEVNLLPQTDFEKISGITTRLRYNQVVHTGVPGFIARGK